MENFPAASDHDHDDTDDHHDHDDTVGGDDAEDTDDQDDDDQDLGQVSLSSSSPLIAFVSNTNVGRSATLASLLIRKITKIKNKQTNKTINKKQKHLSATLASLLVRIIIKVSVQHHFFFIIREREEKMSPVLFFLIIKRQIQIKIIFSQVSSLKASRTPSKSVTLCPVFLSW